MKKILILLSFICYFIFSRFAILFSVVLLLPFCPYQDTIRVVTKSISLQTILFWVKIQGNISSESPFVAVLKCLLKKRNKNILQILVISTLLLIFNLNLGPYEEFVELTSFFLFFKKRNNNLGIILQINCLILILSGILIYFSLVYYFAFIFNNNNLQLLLGFILLYLSIIGIFFYNCSKILWAKSLDKEVPWNFYKDCLIPSLVLFMPLFGALSFHIWLHKIIFLIVLHIFLVIPLLTFWNKYRGLSDISKESNSWKHSQVYIHIALAMIYPLIFILYISLIRYLRLGEIYDIRNISILFDLDIMIFSIIFSPLIVFWIFAFYIFIKELRELLWSYTASISYSIHIKMLEYQDYFFIMEKIFKLHYLYYDIFSLNPGGTTFDRSKVTSKSRKLLSYIYFHPFVLNLIFFSSLCIELIISKGIIYYGIYSLFYYPLIFGIMRCFNLFSSTQFIQDVCMSDYITLRVKNPRYKSKFWSYFADPEYYYGFVHKITPEKLLQLNQMCTLEQEKSAAFEQRASTFWYRVWGYKYIISDDFARTISFVRIGKKHKWSVRVAGAYTSRYHVRWFHTSLCLLSPQSTAATMNLLTKKSFFFANWLNSPQCNYGLIQRFAKDCVWPANEFMYKNLNPNIFLTDPKRLVHFVENNYVMTLSPITKLGWIIGDYPSMVNLHGYPTKDTMQKRSDALIKKNSENPRESFYSGIDQKNKDVTFFGRNQAVVVNEINYRRILSAFLAALSEKHPCNSQMILAINLLSKSCMNHEEHLAIWSKYYSLFPTTWRPPLRLENTFDLKYLTDDALSAYYEQGPRLQSFLDRVEFLQNERRKASENKKNFTEDIFQDSELQHILGQ